MKALFDSEAKRNQVYPLLPLRQLISRPEDSRTKFVFHGDINRLQDTMNVHTGAGTGYTITAKIANPGTAEGVIIAQGSRYGGFTLFVKNRHVYFEVNSFGHLSGQLVSAKELPQGASEIVVEVTPSASPKANTTGGESGNPFPATATLTINGTPQANGALQNLPASGGYWSAAETLDIGSDLGSPVSQQYTSPFRFSGTIDTVTLQLHESKGATDREKAAARNDGHS